MYRFTIIFAVMTLVRCDFKIQILHNNDMHARFMQVDRHLGRCKDDSSLSCYGGFARVQAAVSQYKKDADALGRPTIFLNAGDTFSGTPYYTIYKWHIAAELMNTLGVDVMTLGNHEFDDGVAGLAPYLRHLTVPVVCTNLDLSQEPALQLPNLTPSKTLVINGTKVGVIGYLVPDVLKLNMGGVNILNEIPSIRDEAQRLIREGVKILIALGHSGYDKDLVIAAEVEEIDVVVGAHSHTFLYTGTPPDIEKPAGPYPTVVTQESGKQVPVVQAYCGTKYLGRLDLDFDDEGNLKSFNGSPIMLTGNFTQSENVLKILEPFEKEVSMKTRRILGYTHVLLDNTDCWISECNLGNMITDAYVDYMATHCQHSEGWALAAVGLQHVGGIRASIDAVTEGHNGSISVEDVMTVLPFGNPLVVLKLPGSVLLELLEFSVGEERLTDTDGGIKLKVKLQVSGLRVTYDETRQRGSRVVDVKVLCADCKFPRFETLSWSKSYGVVVPEYFAKGGDGFSMLINRTYVCVSQDEDHVVFANYIESQSPLNPRIEHRIVIVRGNVHSTFVIIITVCFLILALYLFFSHIATKSNTRIRYSLLWPEEEMSSVSTVAINMRERNNVRSAR